MLLVKSSFNVIMPGILGDGADSGALDYLSICTLVYRPILI